MKFEGNIGTLIPLIDDNGLPKYNSFLWHRIPLFDYQNISPALTFIDDDGIQYQMDNHFETDGGSIPPSLRLIPFAHLDPFNFPRAYLFHDCAYQYGGLYIKYLKEEKFLFRLMTHKQVDVMLEKLLKLDNATAYDRFIITRGVAIGSPFIWDEKNKPLKQKEERRNNGIVVYDVKGNIIKE